MTRIKWLLLKILNAEISRGSKLAQFYDVKSQEVYEAIHTLKSGKMDGTINLCSVTLLILIMMYVCC